MIIGAAAADLSESSDATLTSKTDLSLLSDEGLELSQRQTDTMFQGPSLDDQAEELIIGTIQNCHGMEWGPQFYSTYQEKF